VAHATGFDMWTSLIQIGRHEPSVITIKTGMQKPQILGTPQHILWNP